jgi:molybdate transport system substrate-binding protein
MKSPLWLLMISVLLLTGCMVLPAQQVVLTVSAAANVQPALEEIAAAFEEETGTKVAFNFGATAALAQQITAGAPVDVFLAANTSDVAGLAERGLILPETVRPYAVGQLVIYSPPDAARPVTRVEELADEAIGRVAIANPERAPYGAAAREALQAVGVWEAVQDKLVMGENVAQAFQYAETGNVEAALTPLSLTIGKPGSVSPVPETLYRPIIQSLGVVKASPQPDAALAFADFVTGPAAAPIFLKYGYRLP